jgi:hypothetical protein
MSGVVGDANGRVVRSALLETSAERVRGLLDDMARGAASLAVVRSDPARGLVDLSDRRDPSAPIIQATIYALEENRSQFATGILVREPHGEAAIDAARDRIDGLVAALVDRAGGEPLALGRLGSDRLTRGSLGVEVSARVDAGADDVWSLIGDRFGFPRWHPMISDSLSEDAGRHRRDMLEGLANGGALEKFLFHDPAERSYVYAKVADQRIDRGWDEVRAQYFFPFRQYHAQIAVQPAPAGCIASWRGWLALEEAVTGEMVERASLQTRRFYARGLEALVARFGGVMLTG